MTQQPRRSRRHHHVWQHYLEPWTTDGAIWCRQDGRIFSTGTRAVAVETDFHVLPELTPVDVQALAIWLSRLTPMVQEACAPVVNTLLLPVAVPQRLQGADAATRERARQFVERFRAEAVESFHTHVEGNAIPLLARARQGDLSFYGDDEGAARFLHFLALQFMRTKGPQQRAGELGEDPTGLDLARVWNIVTPMFATAHGVVLFSERKRRTLTRIANETGVPFITGDQPVVNLLASPSRDRDVDAVSLYYPIGPDSALLLSDEDKPPLYPATGLSRGQASELNERLAQACHRQVFAASKASLEALPECVG
jgi:Protein of unknown function (DUF4238)